MAALRTPVIYLVREPEIPLGLSWTFVLSHPITFAPDGTFIDPSLEVSLGPGGRLNGEIRSLLELAADPTAPQVDVAIAPVLLTQLGRMVDGYRVAEEGGIGRSRRARAGRRWPSGRSTTSERSSPPRTSRSPPCPSRLPRSRRSTAAVSDGTSSSSSSAAAT